MNLNNFLAKSYPNKTLKQHNDDLIERLIHLVELGYIINKEDIALLKIIIKYHDFGKVNPYFQDRIKKNTKFDVSKEVYHNILSIYFVKKEDFISDDEYILALSVIFFHHAYTNNIDYKSKNINLIKQTKDDLKLLIKDIELFKVNSGYFEKMNNLSQSENKRYLLLKGFLHKCDYSASSNLPVEVKNDFLDQSLIDWKMNRKLKEPTFDFNDLQLFSLKNKNENILITGSTGIGKTEAALLWSGNNKMFFFLPLKASTNAIYNRIKNEILNNIQIEERISLLDSDNFKIFQDNNEESSLEYYYKSKNLSLPINISTIDQLFDFVYKYINFELKYVTLSYSKINIDEIQTFNSKLLAVLLYGIKLLQDFNAKFNIMSATFPPFLIDLLEGKILKDGPNLSFKKGVFLSKNIRHSLKVKNTLINTDDIVKHYNNHIGQSRKYLIICNTVKKSQQIFLELKDKLPKDEIQLLHSRFVRLDRYQKEYYILKVGKTEIYQDIIFISTQIVEASLDIDFDYLFTELSDLNGLIQRLGRINRKGIKTVSEYNSFVYTLQEKYAESITDETIFTLSKTNIQKIDGLFSEKDKVNLINETLTTDNLKNSEYIKELKKEYEICKDRQINSLKKQDVNLRNINNYSIIPLVVFKKNQLEIENLLKVTNNDLKSYSKRLKAKETLKLFTLDIDKKRFYKLNLPFFRLEIDKSNYLFVLNAKYDSELGLNFNEIEENDLFIE